VAPPPQAANTMEATINSDSKVNRFFFIWILLLRE
jgi:hypothetical protein